MNIHSKLDPDFSRMLKVLKRDGEPDRVPFVELLCDREFMSAMLGKPFPKIRGIFEHGLVEVDREKEREYYLKEIEFWHKAGFDYISVRPFIPFKFSSVLANDTAEYSKGDRSWHNTDHGIISNEEDFENYLWPSAEDVDYWNVEFVSKNLPEGMKIITTTYGIFETVMWLLGFSRLAMGIYENPEFIKTFFDRVGSFFLDIYKTVTKMDNVGAVWMGDDMGFKTSTLVSPEHLREYVFPWTKRIVEVAHQHDLPFLFHSCGNRDLIIDDLIDDIKIDAIHSFEDTIMPVTEAKKKYGDKIAILGGVDMDVLGSADLDHAESYVENVLQTCAPGGAYALGSGNSAANYLKIDNYKKMLEKGFNYRY